MAWDGVERRKRQRERPKVERVMIVEDSEFVAETIKRGLRDVARTIHSTDTIAGCFYLMGISSYDYIILDNKLPDGEGTIVAPRIKDKSPSTKIILVTSHPMDDCREMMRGGIIDMVLDKFDDWFFELKERMILKSEIGNVKKILDNTPDFKMHLA